MVINTKPIIGLDCTYRLARRVWKDQDAQEGGELGFSKNLSNL